MTSSPLPELHLRRSGALALVAAAMVGLLMLVVGLLMRQPARDHPGAWDPRVNDIVAFVERARGRPFRHAVKVTFLADQAFVERVQQQSAPSKKAIRENTWRSASLRSLGLAEGSFDLLASSRQALGGGVYGFYDPDKDEMVIRGDQLTGTVRSTLAHELTHAWQDQWYGLDREFADSEATAGWNALVEGDATYVGELYKARELSSDERIEAADLVEGVAAQLADVPDVVVSSLSFPYEFGLGYVLSLYDGVPLASDRPSERTVAALDKAFADPPTSTRAVVELQSDVRRIKVPSPRLDDGQQWLNDDVLGSQGLFLAVDERLGYASARSVAKAWLGDATRFYRQGTKVCVRTELRVDASDTDRVASTMAAWAAKMPDATTRRSGRNGVLIQSCDPGASAKLSPRPHSLPGSTALSVEQLFVMQSGKLGSAGARLSAVASEAVACALASDPADVETLLDAASGVLPKLMVGAGSSTGSAVCPKGA